MDTQLVINKLIETTKSDNLKWIYLDTFKPLSDASLSFFTSGYKHNNSFFVKINKGFFVLVDSGGYLYLTVFPTLDSREVTTINCMNDGSVVYQDELLRLLNIVKKQFPQVDDILSDLLNDNF